MNFRYGDAVEMAQSYQTKHPEWLVCGSLALMLAGHMRPRRLSDIDFATKYFPPFPNSNDYTAQNINVMENITNIITYRVMTGGVYLFIKT